MKAIIYNRTSTKKQNPELQLKDCIDFAKEKNLEVIKIISEEASAFKQKQKRWDEVVKLSKKEKADIILWRYDRGFRNRKEFYKFMKVMFEVYGIKVYSVKEPSILSFWEMINKSHSDNPVFDNLLQDILKALWDFIIQQAGEEAEEESRKKGERVRLSVVKEENKPTKSYKGKIWGRKRIPKNTVERVIKLYHEGLSVRAISKQVSYYDNQRNLRNISKSAVHKIIAEINA